MSCKTSPCGVECWQLPAKPRSPRGRSGGRQRHRDSATPSASSSHISSSESPDLMRAVTVEGDRAIFSEIMQIITSAVRGILDSRRGNVCGRPCLLVHNASSGRKRPELSPSPAENNQVSKSCRFRKVCVNGVPRSSDSPIPTQTTTMVKEPEFHPSSPAILQRLVRVVATIGPHSSLAVEVSNRSELTMPLLQRHFQHNHWLRRVMSALRNSGRQNTPRLVHFGTRRPISLASTSSTPTNVAPQWQEASGHSWIGSDAKWVEPCLPILRSWHRSSCTRRHQVHSLR